MTLSSEQIHEILKEKYGEVILEEHLDRPNPWLLVRPDMVEQLSLFCRDEPRLRLDLLTAITGVDYPERSVIEVIYCLESTTQLTSLIFKVALPREEPHVPTVEHVWRTADWHERETFDLLGVHFDGHHNLERILCAEDWEGHPLRRDYVIPETFQGLKNVIP